MEHALAINIEVSIHTSGAHCKAGPCENTTHTAKAIAAFAPPQKPLNSAKQKPETPQPPAPKLHMDQQHPLVAQHSVGHMHVRTLILNHTCSLGSHRS